MDFAETHPEAEFRMAARGWLQENIPDPDSGPDLDRMRSWAQRLAASGYGAVNWPERYGGLGLSFSYRSIWFEEAARAGAPEGVQTMVDLLGSTLLARGTPEQCDRYLKPLLCGDEIWCQGFSEPDAGSDLASLRTTAARVGDDQWALTGHKTWTSHARFATHSFVLARTSGTAGSNKGITFFIVPLDQRGVTIRPLRQMTGDADRFADFYLDGAIAIDTIGDEGDGWSVAMTTLGHERFTRTFLLWMHQRRELDEVLERHGPILDPVQRQHLAWLESRVRVLRWSLLRYLAMIEAGARPDLYGSLLKLLWSETDQRLHEIAMDLGGLQDLLTTSPNLERFLYTRAETIFAGSSEIQRNILGERWLGLPRR